SDGAPGVPPGRTGESPVPTRARRIKLFCCRRFFVDNDLQVRAHVLVQLDGDGELADRLQRLVQLDLAAIDVEALFLEPFGNIARRDRTEQLIAFARLAQELHFESVELLGQRLGFRLFGGGAAHGGGFHLLDDSLVGGGGLNRQFLGQQKIPPVSLGDFYYLTAVAQL